MKNITETDLKLAEAFYPVLIEVAHARDTITYGELLERAKRIATDEPQVQRAIPVSTGRRLDVVRAFTQRLGYPDLTSLVINASTHECGSGFTKSFDPVQARAQVADFDWDSAQAQFKSYLVESAQELRRARKPKPRRIDATSAAQAMYDYYRANRERLPRDIRKFRERIIANIRQGLDVPDAFNQAIAGV